MYIEPNSKIYILKKCPLDLSLDHTIFFPSKEKQREYFESLAKHKLDKQSYTRYEKGAIKVEIPADQLYECNYLMFQNTSFGSRWFYAYISSVDYISNSVSRVNFTIDIMQTWFFDYELEQCFIEREHTVTDYIGENLIDEGLELGEYIIEHEHYYWDDWKYQSINIVCTFGLDEDGNVSTVAYTEGGFYSNIYCGLHIYSFPDTIEGTSKANAFLKKVTEDGASAGVVSVFMCPTFMVQQKKPSKPFIDYPTYKHRSIPKPYNDIDGYKPRNKKLFNYPFKYLQVTTDNGDSHTYQFELFNSNDKYEFDEYYVFSAQPECTAIPNKYKTLTNINRDERLNLSDFPNCAFTIDSYLAWLAQKRVSYPFDTANSLIRPMAGLAGLLNPVSALTSAASSQLDFIKETKLAQLEPPKTNGTIAGGGLTTAIYRKGFDYKDMSIRAEFAKRIDDYFTVFGYKVNKLGIPSRNNRPHWTYVKTVNCCIRGSVPCDDAKAICDIFNNGITFWRYGNEVGNYSLDNSP